MSRQLLLLVGAENMNNISKSRIEKKMQRKTSKEIVDTIMKAKKSKSWLEIANLISVPRRLQASINIDEIDKISKEGDTVLVPGKVLGNGDISKKIRIVSLYFSKSARDKLKARKCEIVSVAEEIKENPNARGIKVIR